MTRLIVMGLGQCCLACGRAVNLFHSVSGPNLNCEDVEGSGERMGGVRVQGVVCHLNVTRGLSVSCVPPSKGGMARDS